MKKEIIIYQAENGALELRGDIPKGIIWASQAQVAILFGVDQSVVSRHIKNVFKDGEMEVKSNMQKMHIANSDKPVAFYSLDVILAVGYRTNSHVAIEFRQWATKTLHEHIVNGYTINKKRLAKNYEELLRAVEAVKNLLPAGGEVPAKDALDLVKLFATTWFSLDAYDHSALPKSGATKKQTRITAAELITALGELKRNFLKKGEGDGLFGQERQKDSVAGIVGNVFQSVFGRDAYETLEEKAAHLLYFFVKNHPFADGNKRSGAFVFVWFLNKAGILRKDKLTPEALTALTLLVAESAPKDKDRMIGLILLILKK